VAGAADGERRRLRAANERIHQHGLELAAERGAHAAEGAAERAAHDKTREYVAMFLGDGSTHPTVGRCRLTVSKLLLKAPVASALEPTT